MPPGARVGEVNGVIFTKLRTKNLLAIEEELPGNIRDLEAMRGLDPLDISLRNNREVLSSVSKAM